MKTRQPDWTQDKDGNWCLQDARIFPAEDTIKGFILTAAGILIVPFESAEEAMRYHEENFLINGEQTEHGTSWCDYTFNPWIGRGEGSLGAR